MLDLNKEFQKAVSEIGGLTAINPIWSEEDKMFLFEHPLYPRVIAGYESKTKTKTIYLRALKSFVEHRINGTISKEADRVTKGRAGIL